MEITITIKATISKDELKARMLEIFARWKRAVRS